MATRDPLLLTKILGAVLAGAWAIVIAAGLGMMLYHPEETVEDYAYPVVVEEAETVAGAETAAETPAGEETAAETPAGEETAAEAPAEEGGAAGIATMLASADADDGQKVARKCAACHTFDEGGANRVGPNLWGVVNKDVGSHEGYSYSSAMADLGGEWTYEKLDAFLADPKGYVSGTKMSFAGIKDPEDRADLIAYLRSLSGDPAPLP